jgi:hypothetical protein
MNSEYIPAKCMAGTRRFTLRLFICLRPFCHIVTLDLPKIARHVQKVEIHHM